MVHCPPPRYGKEKVRTVTTYKNDPSPPHAKNRGKPDLVDGRSELRRSSGDSSGMVWWMGALRTPPGLPHTGSGASGLATLV